MAINMGRCSGCSGLLFQNDGLPEQCDACMGVAPPPVLQGDALEAFKAEEAKAEAKTARAQAKAATRNKAKVEAEPEAEPEAERDEATANK